MGSAYPLKTKRDYGDKTRIDMNQLDWCFGWFDAEAA